MTRMNAAVVTSFAEPPRDQPFEVPQRRRDGEVLVDVIAVGRITVTTSTVPLADVEQAWTRPETPGERTVLVP